MCTAKFSDDFKRDAVHQIVERGYPVAEVSKRLAANPHSLYAWKKRFAKPGSRDGSFDEKAAEVRPLKLELARVTEARGILKEQRRTSLIARCCRFKRCAVPFASNPVASMPD